MAEMVVVRRSNGEKVKLVCGFVDRPNQQMGIQIPQCNALIIFSDLSGEIKVIDRQAINFGEKAQLHTSQSVYEAMARWAGSILNAKREVTVEKTQE